MDMVANYPGCFLGYGVCYGYFKRFGYPHHEMIRISINGPLPKFDLTGFARIVSFEISSGHHPICFGRHFSETYWTPIVLLRYMIIVKY